MFLCKYLLYTRCLACTFLCTVRPSLHLELVNPSGWSWCGHDDSQTHLAFSFMTDKPSVFWGSILSLVKFQLPADRFTSKHLKFWSHYLYESLLFVVECSQVYMASTSKPVCGWLWGRKSTIVLWWTEISQVGCHIRFCRSSYFNELQQQHLTLRLLKFLRWNNPALNLDLGIDN